MNHLIKIIDLSVTLNEYVIKIPFDIYCSDVLL